jgi:hypothetical protein
MENYNFWLFWEVGYNYWALSVVFFCFLFFASTQSHPAHLCFRNHVVPSTWNASPWILHASFPLFIQAPTQNPTSLTTLQKNLRSIQLSFLPFCWIIFLSSVYDNMNYYKVICLCLVPVPFNYTVRSDRTILICSIAYLQPLEWWPIHGY